MNFLTDLAAIIGSTTDNGGATPLASSASKDYAMKNWLHDSWAHLLEAQFDDVEGQDASETAILYATVDGSGNYGTGSGRLAANDSAFGFDQFPTNFKAAIKKNTTCFPWYNYNLADSNKSRYIVVVKGKIYKYAYTTGGLFNETLSQNAFNAAKAQVVTVAKAKYLLDTNGTYGGSSNANSASDAAALISSAESTLAGATPDV